MAFSLAIFFLGLTAACLGPTIQKMGASKGGLLSALCFGLGLIGAGFACQIGNLALFYLFFGILSGIGLGIGYIAPISTLVRWFPDRRGLATGLAIMGFGFGGLICAKLIDQFVPAQAEIVLPTELSTYEHLQSGNTTANYPSLESFQANAQQLQKMEHAGETETSIYLQLQATQEKYRTTLLYDKSTISRAFYGLGILYVCLMIPSALYISPPPADYEAQFANSPSKKKSSKQPIGEMSASAVLKRPGFYGLWLMLFLNASCGIAVISTAKKMGYEMVHLPDAMASLMVMGISLFNGLGRIGWATFSDRIGRPNTFTAFFIIQMIAFPLLANVTMFPMAFLAITFVIITCYGGAFSTIPAYISDLYGLKSMSTVLGYILTAWSMAGLVGPMLNAYVYEKTHSYQFSLYFFGGTVIAALVLSILMRWEVKSLPRHYQMATDEAELNNLQWADGKPGSA